jgi:Flp pilus assembly pilin Flp
LLRNGYSGYERGKSAWRKSKMHTVLLKLYVKLQELSSREEGQDLVEYALIVALLTFGVAAATRFLAAGLATTFGTISTSVGSYVT